MGFIEVVKNLPTILKNLSFCKRDIDAFVPDVLVLIDYPGFNLRIADWAKKKGIKTVYYISPQVWAWKESRVKKIKECVDKMLVILPFEERFYQKWQYPVEYVGHPLVEVIDQFKAHNTKINTQKNIAVLPGSRKQEIVTKLPIMLSVAKHFPEYNFVVAKAPGVEEAFYQQYLNQHNNVSSVSNDTYSLLLNASAAMVTSGTATLETALFGVPEVVCYKGSAISYAIAKKLLTIKYISLVNLIMNKLVVQELIQDELNENNLHQALKSLLNNDEVKSSLQAEYKALHQLLSKGGNASKKAALAIYQFVCK
jgi:lipid-A-disaccharide synthase